MWLAKPVYESVPAVFMAAGAAVVLLGLNTSDAFLQGVLLVPGLAVLTLGLVLVLRRRAYRQSRSRSRYDKIT